MMELGVFSRTYEINDLTETCRRMQADGLRHTQFNFSNAGMATLPEQIEEGQLDRIRRITQEHGVILDALSGTFNMIDPDADARQRGCDQFRLQCEAARELGIPMVSLCTGSRHPQSKWKWHDDNRRQDAWDDLLRSTEQILRYAEDNHVILGVEPEISNIIYSAELTRKYLDVVKSPYLKIIMDGANLIHPEHVNDMERIMEEAFAMLGQDIVLAHAKDLVVDTDVSFVAAGCGRLNYPYYIQLLQSVGYTGPLIMHGLSETQIAHSKVFLEDILCRYSK